ncbi:MAG: hydrogenase iron-sulfur subunit [Candidatus Hodarchaeales archaeon]
MEQQYGLLICKCRGEIDNYIPIDELANIFQNNEEIKVCYVANSLCDATETNKIQSMLKIHRPQGVIIAGCSPRFYESYFRSVMEKSGINAGKLQFANIREQLAWVFGKDSTKDFMLSKAKLSIEIAMKILDHSHDFVATKVKINKSVAILGAGLGGIQTALSVARSGIDAEIHLLERSTHVGGPQLKYSKAFPRDECSACAISPLIAELKNYTNIHIHTNVEAIDCLGRVGDYNILLKQHPRYVNDRCISCAKCSDVCPMDISDDTETHRVIYLPFAGTIPELYAIDEPNVSYCRNECHDQPCLTACPIDAINLDDTSKEIKLNVGAIVIATGASVHQPEDYDFGYGKNSDVLTLDQYEKLLTASSKWKGEVRIPSEPQKTPESVAFVLCVHRQTLGYCSKYCCLSTAAAVRQTAEKLPLESKIYVFYQDLFSDSKFGDDYLKATQKLPNVQWIRTIPRYILRVTSDNKTVSILDVPVSGGRVELQIDLLILATGLRPSDDNRHLRHIFGLDSSKEGFFSEFDLLFSPVSTNDIGKFLVGTASGPKTIPETTISALAVGSQLTNLLGRKEITIPISVTEIEPDLCSACGVCIKTCPYHANTIDEEKEIAVIEISRCRGCGNCVVSCPSNARDIIEYPDQAIHGSIDLFAGSKAVNGGPRMLAFLCNGCGYPAADNVGLSGAGIKYSPNLSVIRVPCSGRVDPKHILHALNMFDGVMIGACKLHSCHFSVGNFDAQKRIFLLQGTMQAALINPERLEIDYFSPTDTELFCDAVNQFERVLKQAMDKENGTQIEEKDEEVLASEVEM